MSPDNAISDKNPENSVSVDPLQQMNQLQAIVRMEQELTRLIEKAQPWIQSSNRTARHTGSANGSKISKEEDEDDSFLYHGGGRVRPIPTTMEQMEEILCLARTYAHRTSAPPGWIATAPVLNFSTPSPLPHHLRNGALAALQLQRALQQQKQQLAAERAAVQRAVELVALTPAPTAEAAPMDIEVHPSSAKTQLHQATAAVPPSLPAQPKRPRQEITMNLSDDSSSDEDDE
jgi:hypothetical protein